MTYSAVNSLPNGALETLTLNSIVSFEYHSYFTIERSTSIERALVDAAIGSAEKSNNKTNVIAFRMLRLMLQS